MESTDKLAEDLPQRWRNIYDMLFFHRPCRFVNKSAVSGLEAAGALENVRCIKTTETLKTCHKALSLVKL